MNTYLVKVYYEDSKIPSFGILVKSRDHLEAREITADIASRNKPGASFNLVDWCTSNENFPISMNL